MLPYLANLALSVLPLPRCARMCLRAAGGGVIRSPGGRIGGGRAGDRGVRRVRDVDGLHGHQTLPPLEYVRHEQVRRVRSPPLSSQVHMPLTAKIHTWYICTCTTVLFCQESHQCCVSPELKFCVYITRAWFDRSTRQNVQLLRCVVRSSTTDKADSQGSRGVRRDGSAGDNLATAVL